MGMFDYLIGTDMWCPRCGGDLGWQTRDAAQCLEALTVQEVMRDKTEMDMTGSCDECSLFIEAAITKYRDWID